MLSVLHWFSNNFLFCLFQVSLNVLAISPLEHVPPECHQDGAKGAECQLASPLSWHPGATSDPAGRKDKEDMHQFIGFHQNEVLKKSALQVISSPPLF